MFCIEIADSMSKRLIGLLGKKTYPLDHVMWFSSCFAIHTWGMAFAIDAVFLDKRGRVLSVIENIPPWRCVMCWGADSVLECSAGGASALGLDDSGSYFSKLSSSRCDEILS